MIDFDFGVVQSHTGVATGTPVKSDACDEIWFQMSSGVGTIAVFGSLDGTNYQQMFFQTFAAATSPTTFVNSVTTGFGRVPCEGLKWLRFDCTAFTSGPININATGIKRS